MLRGRWARRWTEADHQSSELSCRSGMGDDRVFHVEGRGQKDGTATASTLLLLGRRVYMRDLRVVVRMAARSCRDAHVPLMDLLSYSQTAIYRLNLCKR